MTGYFILGLSCGLFIGCCVTWLLLVGVDWDAWRERRSIRRSIPRAEVRRREMLASVVQRARRRP